MKPVVLLLTIVCIFVFFGCEQDEKGKELIQSEFEEVSVPVKEKRGESVERLKKRAEEASEALKRMKGDPVEK